jgi:hypothetical protein
MAIVWLYGALLFAAYSGPTLLTLSSYTYGIMTLARFVSFLVSVTLFVMLGKSLKKRQRRRFSTGLVVGAAVAIMGTGASQAIRHLPQAENAFAAQMPGVPHAAAMTMLHLHMVASVVLSAIMYGVLFGLLGAVAVWWGGRTPRTRPPEHPTPEHEMG